jgi:hypothetical protein
MLSLSDCRALIPVGFSISDQGLALIRDQLTALAHAVVDSLSCQKPNSGPMDIGESTFEQLLYSLDDKDRYELTERAAILEFDNNIERRAAERLALRESLLRIQ